MAKIRMLPPADGKTYTLINGRTYNVAPGNVLDMLDHDAMVAAGNGWTPVLGLLAGMDAQVGTTAQRPGHASGDPRARRGQLYIDTTVNAVIVWDGLAWRNALTGAAV